MCKVCNFYFFYVVFEMLTVLHYALFLKISSVKRSLTLGEE